jgi:hypothetical protein
MTKFTMTTALAIALLAQGLPALADGGAIDAFAARHFNQGVSVADRQTKPGAAGAIKTSRSPETGASLATRAAIHFNRGVAAPDQMATTPAGRPDPALDAYAAAHFNRGVAAADRQAY